MDLSSTKLFTLDVIKYLSNLHSLVLNGSTVGRKEIVELCKVNSKLQLLDITCTAARDAEVELIAKTYPQLKIVSLGGILLQNQDCLVTLASSCKNLEVLFLFGCSVKKCDTFIHQLANLQHLRILYLAGSSIDFHWDAILMKRFLNCEIIFPNATIKKVNFDV